MKFIIFTHFIELTDLNLITIQITLRTMLTDLHLKTKEKDIMRLTYLY